MVAIVKQNLTLVCGFPIDVCNQFMIFLFHGFVQEVYFSSRAVPGKCYGVVAGFYVMKKCAPTPTPARKLLSAAKPGSSVPPFWRSSTVAATPRFLRSSSFNSNSATGFPAGATYSRTTATARPPYPTPPRASRRPQCNLSE